MLDIKKLDRTIVFDIETVPIAPTYETLAEDYPHLSKAFEYYCKYTNKTPELSCEEYYQHIGSLEPEYGKIVCFSFGKINYEENEYTFDIRSYADEDEVVILKKISKLMYHVQEKNFVLGGHNIKGFDIPFLIKRFILNGMQVPDILWMQDKKPWEIGHLDTKEIWKFGSWNQNISMVEMAIILGIQSPKDIMDGSEVKHEFWVNHNLEKIKTYCEGDVRATSEIFLRLSDWFYKIKKS